MNELADLNPSMTCAKNTSKKKPTKLVLLYIALISFSILKSNLLLAQSYLTSYGFFVEQAQIPSYSQLLLSEQEFEHADGLFIDIKQFFVSETTNITLSASSSEIDPYLYLVSVVGGNIINVWESHTKQYSPIATISVSISPGLYWVGTTSLNRNKNVGEYALNVWVEPEEVSLARELVSNPVGKQIISPAVTSFERSILEIQDWNFRPSTFNRDGEFESYVRSVASKAGIVNTSWFQVAIDFQSTNFRQIGGGVAGYEAILIDGKYVDILFDYAIYLTLLENGRTSQSSTQAINTIVAHHNRYIGYAPIHSSYSPSSVSSSEVAATVDKIQSLLAFIVYHEFGHVYLNHQVKKGRVWNFQEALEVYFSSELEDKADLVSGMLTAKSNLDSSLAIFGMQVMHFYLDQRAGFRFSIDQPASGSFFDNPYDNYSSLPNRMQNFSIGLRNFGAGNGFAF